MTRDIAALPADCTAAWNGGSDEDVASIHAEVAGRDINRRKPWEGCAGMRARPDRSGSCDAPRLADSHVAHLWTLTGNDTETHNALSIVGLEEPGPGACGKLAASGGGFDAEDYGRQVSG